MRIATTFAVIAIATLLQTETHAQNHGYDGDSPTFQGGNSYSFQYGQARAQTNYGEKSVEITYFSVPPKPIGGSNVTLVCRFSVHGPGHRLYTVNWWRGKDQFYTYKATKPFPTKNGYRFLGIDVDTDHSTEEEVLLRNVSEESSGEYKCEVMGEGPAFKTAVEKAMMHVIIPPRLNIATFWRETTQKYHRHGDEVRMNCTSEGSKPRAELYWLINGRPVSQGETSFYHEHEDQRGRVTSVLNLSFRAPAYFVSNRARVLCVASVSGVEFKVQKDLYLDPASSAAFNHQYASAGCQMSLTWQFLSMFCFFFLVHRME